MLLNGIQPPPIGSVRDVVLTRMYSMDQMQKHFDLYTMGMLMLSASGGAIPQNDAQQVARKNVENILARHGESIAYANWSGTVRSKPAKTQQTDEDIMRRVALMGRMYNGE